MRVPRGFRELMAQTGGTPTENVIRPFIKSKNRRIYFKKSAISLLGISLFVVSAYFTYDQILPESIVGTIFSLGLFAIVISMATGVTVVLANHGDDAELRKGEYALNCLIHAQERINGIVQSDEAFILCLRGFEGERIGWSEKSRPLTAYELHEQSAALDKTRALGSGPSSLDLERSNAIRQYEYNPAWVQQLGVLAAIRTLGPVVLLDNFELEPDKRAELERSKILALPTTSDTWWGVFLELAVKARLVVVLLEQRSASVVEELDYLSGENSPYVILTKEGMVAAMLRLAPCFVKRAAAVIRRDELQSAEHRIREIWGEANGTDITQRRTSETACLPGVRQRLEQQATAFSALAHTVDWSCRAEVVFQLALRFPGIKWLTDWREPDWMEHLYRPNIVALCFGVIFCLVGIIWWAFLGELPFLLNLGVASIAGGGIGLLFSHCWFLRLHKKHAVAASRLRTELAGRNYRDLMASLNISEEEIQWVYNVLQTQKHAK
jgi:hypothetical protein